MSFRGIVALCHSANNCVRVPITSEPWKQNGAQHFYCCQADN